MSILRRHIGDVRMIEADIVLGTLDCGNGTIVPIMAHPPNTTSNLSLETFLRTISVHNIEHPNNVKGVKLDFKSIESFDGALNLLKSIWQLVIYRMVFSIAQQTCNRVLILHFTQQMTCPVWINADILSGPVHSIVTKPVDANRFLQGCKQLPRATLSLGWTTLWGPLFQIGKYTHEHINHMVDAINRNEISSIEHRITFPVRAGIAAQSEDTLTELFRRINHNRTESNCVTLTIWSSPHDYVNVPLLRQLIVTIGYDRVYVDVPADLRAQLNL